MPTNGNFFFSRLCSRTYSWALSRALCHFLLGSQSRAQPQGQKTGNAKQGVLKALHQWGLSLSSLLQNSPCSFVPLNVQLTISSKVVPGQTSVISTQELKLFKAVIEIPDFEEFNIVGKSARILKMPVYLGFQKPGARELGKDQ